MKSIQYRNATLFYYYYSNAFRVHRLGFLGFYISFNRIGCCVGFCKPFSIHKWHEWDIGIFNGTWTFYHRKF